VLIRRAELNGQSVDLRLDAGRVVAIGPALDALPGEEQLNAAGGALLPGLHDHHLHLFALAAAERSLACGPPAVRDRAALASALAGVPEGDDWIRGIGYHDSVAGELDRHALDQLLTHRPLRIQHRSGAMWLLNSRGVDALQLDAGADAPGVERDERGQATGRIYREDGFLRERLPSSDPPDLARVGSMLAGFGVTGVTDATPTNSTRELCAFAAAIQRGDLPQSLLVMGSAELGATSQPGLARGPLKLVLAEVDLPDFDALVEEIRAAHTNERAVAVHCVTRAELVMATAAFAAAGAVMGDRIEHASIAPPDSARALAALPLTVVTQPGFIRERGDAYATDVEASERPWLYRCRGFLELDIPLGAGTDAPFGDPDPWHAIRAAVDRRTEAGLEIGADERLSPERALALFTSPPDRPGAPPRTVEVGAPADLCLLDRPWSSARDRLDNADVRSTFRGGIPIFGR